jgi:hypothetical protein
MHEEAVRCTAMATNENLIECACDVILLDKWILMKWQIIWKLVMILAMKSSTIHLGFIKSVQDESLNNSQCSIKNGIGH